jgi:2,5-furandicarboxylate decarboxylase 1
LADGPTLFSELMVAIGSRDGRDVVRDLDALRQEHPLRRDECVGYVLEAKGQG